jgi:protein-disulfide isomerase
MNWAIVSANVLAVLALGLAAAGLALHFTEEDEEGGAPAGANPTATVARPTAAAQVTPTAPAVVQVSVDDDPGLGPEDAPVTIVEFSDFL